MSALCWPTAGIRPDISIPYEKDTHPQPLPFVPPSGLIQLNVPVIFKGIKTMLSFVQMAGVCCHNMAR